MLLHPLSLLQLLSVVAFALAANWTANPFVPPAVPLAVKSPFLQTWLMQGTAEGSLNSGWEAFRDGAVSHVLGPWWVHILTDKPTYLDRCMVGDTQSGRPILRLDGRPPRKKQGGSEGHDRTCFSDRWVLLGAEPLLNSYEREPSQFTSTKTIITMTCGTVDLTATFLNPIEVGVSQTARVCAV